MIGSVRSLRFAGASGPVGPPLGGIGQRLYVAGVLTNTPENLVRWIQNAPAVDRRARCQTSASPTATPSISLATCTL
jgi:hypothetical protein